INLHKIDLEGLQSDWLNPKKDKNKLAEFFRDEHTDLGKTMAKLWEEPDHGVYLYAAAVNMRLAIVAMLALEEDITSGFNLTTLIQEIRAARAKVLPHANLPARLKYIKCDSDAVVDTFVEGRPALTDDVGSDCSSRSHELRRIVQSRGWGGYNCQCSKESETEPVTRKVKDRNGNWADEVVIPSQTICYRYTLYARAGGADMASFSDSGRRADCDRWMGRYRAAASTVHADAVKKKAFLTKIIEGWDALSLKARIEKAKENTVRKSPRQCNGDGPGAILACLIAGDNVFYAEHGVKRDYSAAADFYRKACKGDSDATDVERITMAEWNDAVGAGKKSLAIADACHMLGHQHMAAKGLPADYLKSLEFYEMACDVGLAKSCTKAGQLWHPRRLDPVGNRRRSAGNEMAKAHPFFRKGCDLGDQDSCGELAQFVRNGWQTETRDPVRARKMYSESCDAGFKFACYRLVNDTSDKKERCELAKAHEYQFVIDRDCD
ncbi:MAG: sel1 repeat family protein, partial [Gammaproteobacteria bacterium]|nr:sel1 repeat family protein [Gammaproteobacteria bacterium]